MIGQNFLVSCKASEFEVIYSEFSVCYAEEHHDAWLSGEARKRGFGPLPGEPNESVAGKHEDELTQE